jgi:stage V sporulation protein B
VALSATPALSAAFRKGKEGISEMRRVAASSLRLTLIVAIPASLGLSVFAEDILSLLFRGQPEAVAQATPWLSCLGLSVPAACLITVTGAMLQAVGKAGRPILSMLAGVAVKTLLAYVLLGQDGWGMAGAPVSSLCCDTVIVAVNLIFIHRHAPHMLPSLREGVPMVAFPTVTAIGAVAAVRLMRNLWGWETVTPLHTLGTVMVVMCLYGAGMSIWLLPKKISTNKKDKNHEQAHQRTA